MPISRLYINAENNSFQFHLGGTLAASGCLGFSIVFSGFGGSINSGGSSILSNLGSRRVIGFAHPVNKLAVSNTRRYFIVALLSSMVGQEA
jgi:hypothetical protein